MNTASNKQLYNHLVNYFNEWKKLKYHPNVTIKPTINSNEFIGFTEQFESHYKTYLNEGNAINIWDICCIGFDELKHCNVLSWLLDDKGSHGFGNEFFHYFIDYLYNRSNFQFTITKDDINIPYYTSTEVHYESDEEEKNSRVDIKIANERFLIFIEAKVQASETNDQLIRYYRLGKKESAQNKNKPWELIFLTKDGRQPKDQQDDDYNSMLNKVICLSWQEIAVLLRRFSTIQSSRPFLQKILNQYSIYIKRMFQ